MCMDSDFVFHNSYKMRQAPAESQVKRMKLLPWVMLAYEFLRRTRKQVSHSVLLNIKDIPIRRPNVRALACQMLTCQ